MQVKNKDNYKKQYYDCTDNVSLIYIKIRQILSSSCLVFSSLSPAGGWCSGTSASGDGERSDCTGPGRGAGLCPAGKLQQWSGFHREPETTLQREPHLCERDSFCCRLCSLSVCRRSTDSCHVCGSDLHRLRVGVGKSVQRPGDLLQAADGTLQRSQLLRDLTSHVSRTVVVTPFFFSRLFCCHLPS